MKNSNFYFLSRVGGRHKKVFLLLSFFLVVTILQLSYVSSLSNNFAYDYLNQNKGNTTYYTSNSTTNYYNVTGGGNPFDQSLNTTDNVTFNSINVSNSGTSIFTDTLDLTSVGAGVIPRLNGHGSLYDILLLRNGVMVDWDDSFPILLLLFNDDNDDGTPEDEPAFTFNAGTDTLLWNDLLGGDVNLATDGNLYEQTDDRVCTVENGLCVGTDYNSTGLIQNYTEILNGTGLIQDWNSTSLIQNYSLIITSAEDLWKNESNIATYNGTINVRGDIQIKNKKTIEVDSDGTVNFYGSI